MVDFKSKKFFGGIDLDRFGLESVTLDASPVDVEWRLQDYLSNVTVEREVIAKLIQIEVV